jgi:hypothetical protein
MARDCNARWTASREADDKQRVAPNISPTVNMASAMLRMKRGHA